MALADRRDHILIIEDDGQLRELTRSFLEANGLSVKAIADGRMLERTLAARMVDLVVLDLMLPGEDGLTLCKRIREKKLGLPIIMVTGVGTEIDRIIGLELGADDYLAKPVSPRELLARIRAVLRRSRGQPSTLVEASPVLRFRGWTLDTARRQLNDASGARVALTTAEFDLLLVFCRHPQRVLSRDQLLDLTQGRGAGPFDRSIDILISRLRSKLEDDAKAPTIITTVRLGGYMFAEKVIET
jgi:two-component system OmpR family response regulator